MVVASALYSASSIALIDNAPIKAYSVERTDAVEASFDKKAIIKDAILINNDRVRVIVELSDLPMAQFSGVNPATSEKFTRSNAKINFNSAAAKEYKSFLETRHNEVKRSLASIDKSFKADFSYYATFNGFAAEVSIDSLDTLLSIDGVKKVYPDATRHAQMDASLDQINAISTWEKVGGKEQAGAGIRVAVIDSGIRPENPLFADDNFEAVAADTLPADDYCSAEPDFCNNKLIVARHAEVPSGFAVVDEEHDSPLGFNGHGTHVAGTAVGNYGVTAERDGATAEISGVAPAARLMVYKGLYATPARPTSSSGTDSMLLSMLEASLMDGADVVNNSWGGGPGGSPEGSPYTTVFESMKDAGVVTVFAAGNDGPNPTTIGCPGCSDDVLTVAATTTNRLFANELNIAGSDSLTGVPAILAGVVPIDEPLTAPIVFAGALDAANFEGCNAFADAAFDGSIALISRGACGFVDKVTNAEAAGAVGVIVYNSPGRGEAPFQMGGLSPDQGIPSVMIPATPGAALAELVAGSDTAVEGTIGDEVIRTASDSLADIMADFSSRGPNGDPSFLKPNLAAPGVRIFSGESPEAPNHVGESFSFKNGTSMASPHVAGAAAILKQMKPDWSATQIKSALVTSSIRDGLLKDDALTPTDEFDVGAGRLDLARASTAELTYSDLSMVDGNCYLECTLSITVTNTSDDAVSVTPSMMFSDSAIDATLTPSNATLPAGASAEITLQLNVASATSGQWALGGINWEDGNPETTDYYVPVAVYPVSSDNASLMSARSSASSAAPGDQVVTEMTASNQAITGMISVTGQVDEKYNLNLATLSATKNGSQEPVTWDAETRTLEWQGALNTASMQVTPDTSIGDLLTGFGLPAYTPMASIGVTPEVCSSVCDDTTLTFNMPQSINYLGQEYSSVIISSNGFISLGTSSGGVSTPTPQILPSLAEPNNVIAPFWTDLDLDGTSDTDSGAGEIYVANLTTGHFVIEWANAEMYNMPGSNISMQIWLEYETGKISMVYGETTAPDLAQVPGVVVGAEDSTGGVGITVAAVTPTTVVGALPAAGNEFLLNASAGDSLEISYAGSVGSPRDFMDDSATVTEDASVNINVLVNDEETTVLNTFTMETFSGTFRSFDPVSIEVADLDTGSLSIGEAPANGTAVINADGTITYTPNADYFGMDSFTYTLNEASTDDTAEVVVVSSNVEVYVEGVQDAPRLNVVAPLSVDEKQDFAVSATATDPDGDAVTITINGEATNAIAVTAPDVGSDTTMSFVVTASDGNSTVTETVTVQVNNKGSGSMGWIALLLAPIVWLRRRAFQNA